MMPPPRHRRRPLTPTAAAGDLGGRNVYGHPCAACQVASASSPPPVPSTRPWSSRPPAGARRKRTRSIFLFRVTVLAGLVLGVANGACNVTKYHEWKTQPYGADVINNEPAIWRYGSVLVAMNNGVAADLAEKWCAKQLEQLVKDTAGRWGLAVIPKSEVAIRSIMCGSVCQETDRIRQEAMEYAECDCLELSTSRESMYYSMEGDFCHANSARILCRVLDRCGSWNCRVSDFMCPRHEYNWVSVPYGLTGDCKSAAPPSLSSGGRGSWVLALVMVMATTLWIHHQQ